MADGGLVVVARDADDQLRAAQRRGRKDLLRRLDSLPIVRLPDVEAAPSNTNRIVVNNAAIKPWSVALGIGIVLLLRAALSHSLAGTVRDVQTLTLFVGNNRLQLQQFGAEPEDTVAGTPGDGSMAALMLRPIGTLSMIGLMLHGAMGRLGEAAGVERFEFER